MTLKKALAGALIAGGLLGGSATAAFAGEVTGRGEPTPAGTNSASRCAFSGLEDFDGAGVDPGVTQNWGQIVRFAGPLGGANNVPFAEDGCNAQLYPNK